MRRAGHVARVGGEGRRTQGSDGEIFRGRCHIEDPGVDVRVILTRYLRSGMRP